MNAKIIVIFQTILLVGIGSFIGLHPFFAQWAYLLTIPMTLSFFLMAAIGLTVFGTIRRLEDRIAILEQRLKIATHKHMAVEHLPEFENLKV